MNKQFHAAVEVADKATDGAQQALHAAKTIAGSEAYRKYNWIHSAPVRNAAGNFRGMVISSRWKAVFHFAEDALKPVERVALFASLAVNIAKSKDEVDQILASQDNWAFKGARLSAQVSSVCLRTSLGVVPAGAHLLALSLGGYLRLADMAGLHRAATWNRALQSLDTDLDTTFDTVTDGNNIYLSVNKIVLTR